MESYEIVYSDIVAALDIPRLGSVERERMKVAIQNKLTRSPDIFGKPLQKPHNGFWSLRVGSYRVIYRITQNRVRIVIIDTRDRVYKELARRINQEL